MERGNLETVTGRLGVEGKFPGIRPLLSNNFGHLAMCNAQNSSLGKINDFPGGMRGESRE